MPVVVPCSSKSGSGTLSAVLYVSADERLMERYSVEDPVGEADRGSLMRYCSVT